MTLAALPVTLSLLWHWRRLMCVVALAGCALPFLLPTSEPTLRACAALLTWLFLIKALQYAAGHEEPQGTVDVLQFLVIPAVVRWRNPRRPDLKRAGLGLATGLLQCALACLLIILVLRVDSRSPVQLITIQIGIYLGLAGTCNLATTSLSLRGLDYDDPFDSPLLARSPTEFWGRRWNTWVHHMLYRYVFRPSGGRHHPVRGTLAAFAVSGAFHEGFAAVGTQAVSGWIGGFFVVQGVLVAASSQWRAFRRLARRAPALAWAATLLVMLATGIMLVRGAEGIDPSHAWRRCCEGP
jgi:hypothetical protein